MLLRTLLQLSLLVPLVPPASVPERLRQQLKAASAQDWQDTLCDLELHRLMPLIYYGIKVHCLIDCVPRQVLKQLFETYFFSLKRNQIFFKTLATVLDQVDAAGVQPILWKGIVLADQLYPNQAIRMMGDIDWAIAPQELETVSQIFYQLGFTLQDHLTTTDAVYFKGENQVFFDVHHRVRLFEGKEHLPLTQILTPHTPGLPNFRVLEPTAMLTHLTVHMTGHMSETGPLLFWILDFVFLLRKWGHLMDWNRLNQLMPDPESWTFLGRLLRFLEIEFNETLPPDFSKFAQGYRPLTFEFITRRCRLAVWGLPTSKGWLRLIAYRLGLKSSRELNYPKMNDLILWIGDSIASDHY